MSQNERLMILQMVADKKISAAEAADLLKALEGSRDEDEGTATLASVKTAIPEAPVPPGPLTPPAAGVPHFPGHPHHPGHPPVPPSPPTLGSGLSAFIEDLVDRVSSTFTNVADPSFEIPTVLTGEFAEGEIPLRVVTGNGRVLIRTWDQPGYKADILVKVRASNENEARSLAQEAFTVNAGPNGFDLEERRHSFRNIAVHTTLYVPQGRNYRLDGRTGNGQVELLDLNLTYGNFTTGNGKMTLRGGQSGVVILKSGNGSIDVEGEANDLELGSGNGSISVRPTGRTSQAIKASTGNGSIRIITGNLPADAGLKVDAHTGMGSVHVGLPNLVYEKNVNSIGHKHIIAHTANYETAASRTNISAKTGLGSVNID